MRVARAQAGLVYGREQVGDIDDAELEIMFNTNVLGLIHLTQVFVREFKQRNAGQCVQFPLSASRWTFSPRLALPPALTLCDPTTDRAPARSIINLGSIAGKEPYAGGAIYTATKHAVHAFNGSLLRELVGYNIRVSQICP